MSIAHNYNVYDMPEIEVTEIEVQPYNMKLRCPRCNNEDTFDVDTTFTVRISSERAWEPQECEMSSHHNCTCLACGAAGRVNQFYIEEDDPSRA
jgi:hypothetical protein